jgi:hypothetical protein
MTVAFDPCLALSLPYQLWAGAAEVYPSDTAARGNEVRLG